MSLIDDINNLRKSQISRKIDSRLNEFSSFKNKGSREWFSELSFCILTANSKARTAISIQKEIGAEGFCNLSNKKLSIIIKKNKHRFHNNKAKYICEARGNIDIKNKVIILVKRRGQKEAREWIVKNINGIGYKEASHFLRNVGYFNLAILDRHILNLLAENGFIKEKPASLSRKNYIEIEKVFNNLSKSLNMLPAELDMYMWYMKTGEVLK
ncbi:N-glycosylase/DNA lyase [Candidatus Woesearchaeota archaeon]|nr:N-glycosylase/DNA lyase [Candidatus Woesearchaeota archaeon]